MIEVTNWMVSGFEPAIHGARNPMNSWAKNDSWFCEYPDYSPTCENCCYCVSIFEQDDKEDGKEDDGENIMCLNPKKEPIFVLGKNDQDLCERLIKAGTEHRKFLRQIQVWVDLTAPLYWWKQFDTYKVGTSANSCSTMHKLTAKPFELRDFSTDDGVQKKESPDDVIVFQKTFMDDVVTELNVLRESYLRTQDKSTWRAMIQILPESYNQRRTVNLNYETLLTICRQRKNHPLSEWKEFIDWAVQLPYMNDFLSCLE